MHEAEENHLHPEKDSPHYGYGGFLIIFCVFQIYVAPLILLFNLLVVPRINPGSYHSVLADDSYSMLTVARVMAYIVIVGFGVYAGIALRRLRPNAVLITKAYLVLALSLALGSASAGGLSALGVLGPATFFTVWFSYFTFSKRIKVTFPSRAH